MEKGERMNWQPIESAPLGTWILLSGDPWSDDYPPVAVGRGTETIDEWWEQTSDTTKELRSRKRIQWECNGLIPEKWMPLPT